MSFWLDGVAPWNSLDDNTRAPLASELEAGYPCGEADQELFNWTAGYPIGQVWNVIVNAGMTPGLNSLLDLSRAIQSGKLNFAVAGGSANALTATLTPATATLTDGMQARLRVANVNSGAATANINGTGAKAIKTLGGADLVAGDLTGDLTLVYNAALDVWVLASLPKGVGPYLLGGMKTLVTSTTWTRPAGCRAIEIEGVGGGGAAGGAQATTAGNASAGGGGGNGAYFRKWLLSPPSSVVVTIGAAGAASAGGNGGNGGTTSFGAIASAGGGIGGQVAAAGSTPGYSSGSGSPTASGGDINIAGGLGHRAIRINGTVAIAGMGQNSLFGIGGPGSATEGNPGNAGYGFGSGGGGAMNISVNAAVDGGAGAPGVIIVREYY